MTQNPSLTEPTAEAAVQSARFLGLIADKLAATEELFTQHLTSDVPFIHQAGDYIFKGGGKRVRPALLLLTSRLLGHDGDEEVTYAAVVEYIHTATLVHDDIIDHATLRRGRETANSIWGNHLTVLLGDWMYTNAMAMALSHHNLEVVRRLCAATLKMIEGELLAFQRLGTCELTAEEYFQIIDRKTAHLFGAACSLPSLIAPTRPEAGEVLHRYGRELGNCFQVVDDLLDFSGRESEMGKGVLADLKEGKLTLPLIVLLPRLSAAQRRKIETVLEDGDFERVSREEILEMVSSEGILEEVLEIARQFGERAKQQLDFFPPGDARDALEFAPDFVLHRRS